MDLELAAAPALEHHGLTCRCVDWACNDDGDGGICTHCGQLHTATVSKITFVTIALR